MQCERIVGFETYEISVPSLPPGIVINDPANVEHVLKNNDIFIKGDFFRTRSWDLFGMLESALAIEVGCSYYTIIKGANMESSGNGIINADGELWRIQRKAGLRFFNNANLKTFIDDVLPPILADTERTLDRAAQQSSQIDLQDVLLELTTRLMGKIAYEVCYLCRLCPTTICF